MDHSGLTFIYKTYRIDPNSTNFPFLAGKYSALSLEALSTDPESFGIAYSSEAALNPTDVLRRLSRPNANVFVCVAHPSNLDPKLQDIEHGVWIGMVTQIGPTPKDIYWLPPRLEIHEMETGPAPDPGNPEPLDDALETKWNHTGTWTHPAHRGKKVAKQMIEAAIAYAYESMTGDVTQIRVRCFTGPDNKSSISLYGSLGFSIVGKCSIAEAMVGNGNSGYPFQGRPNKEWENVWHARLGVAIERVVKKGELVTGSTEIVSKGAPVGKHLV
jgi:GNAT superfamily N-acetyltransferase